MGIIKNIRNALLDRNNKNGSVPLTNLSEEFEDIKNTVEISSGNNEFEEIKKYAIDAVNAVVYKDKQYQAYNKYSA